MLVSAARRRDDADAMRAALEEVVGTIDGEIEGLRTLIRELRPAALDELGPAPAIEELAARTGARHGLEVTTDLAFAGRRSAEVETALYRIIQEALTNAVKHAGATRVAVAGARGGRRAAAERHRRRPRLRPGRAGLRASAWPACASGCCCSAARST